MTPEELREIKRTTRGAGLADANNLRKLYEEIDELREALSFAIGSAAGHQLQHQKFKKKFYKAEAVFVKLREALEAKP